MNRWWTFVLTLCVLSAVCWLHASRSYADPSKYDGSFDGGPSYGGGTPPPPGVGDPDAPVASALKKMQRGSNGSGNASLTQRSVGDSRYVGVSSVWMWRLSVAARALRVYWIR
jgi:hypothetical protein